jgi:hypothetical protein
MQIKAYADKVNSLAATQGRPDGFPEELTGYAAQAAVKVLDANWQAYLGDLEKQGATHIIEKTRDVLRGDIDGTIAELNRFKALL